MDRPVGTPALAPPEPGSSDVSSVSASAMWDFSPGGGFTVGVEEELMLVDEAGQLLGGEATPLVTSLCRRSPDGGVVTGEIYVDQIELNTPPCQSAEDIRASLCQLRGWVASHGARAMAVGVHPSAPFGAAGITPSARYDAIVDEYAGLLRTPTAALQVHVGVPDAETAVSAYGGLRLQMPLLRALAAGSPFWHGVDSGLASTRSAILRSYPRTTVPPLLQSWDDYIERTAALMVAAQVPDPTWVWWDLRPRPALGTLEVRVMDAVPSLSCVAGLTALVQGIARRAAQAPASTGLSDDVLAVNDHRVARHGLDACITDVDGSMRSLREVGRRVVADARAELGPDGLDAPLEVVEAMLREPGAPTYQRRLVAEGGMPALLADLVDRTASLTG